MAWTAPATVATGQLMTAAWFNTYVRDNFLETAPAKASTVGGYFVSTGSNAIAERLSLADWQTTSQTSTSTSYVGLNSNTPKVTATTGTDAIVFHRCELQNNGAGNVSYAAIDVSGASTVAAADATALVFESSAANARMQGTGIVTYGLGGAHGALTGGSNTFTQQYKVDAGTGDFDNRLVYAFPL